MSADREATRRTGLGSRSGGPCRIHLVVELDDDGFVDSTGIYARRGYVRHLAEAIVAVGLTDENAVKVRAVEYGKFRWEYPT